MNLEQNPYASPLAELVEPPLELTSDAEAIRQRYIKHEASVKSIGLLYYIGGFFCVIGTAGALGSVLTRSPRAPASGPWGVEFVVLATFCFLAVASLVCGWGLRRLRPWVRIPVAILSVLGLLHFPVGTLVNGYILYLVLCAKGRMVLSEEYKEIIRQTPHIKYRTSIIAWIVLALFILALISVLVFLG